MVRTRGLARKATRTAARTAVIAGTATSVSGRVARSQQQKFGHAAQPAHMPPAHHADGGDDMVSKLQQLADLKAAGALSDKEFSTAKAKLLAM